MDSRETNDTRTIALCGDVMLGRMVNARIAGRDFAHPWGDVIPHLRQADLFLVNLECALTDRAERWRDDHGKEFYFRADSSVVATLRIGRVDFASVANNHTLDFGVDGLLDTARVLDGAGIAHAGAGADLAEAQRPAILDARGFRVAVVAFADYPSVWAATSDNPGLNFLRVSTDDSVFAGVRRSIAEARRQADAVVFCIHWGPNMRERPTAAFREFAARVLDAGATVFWGHSAHVVQGVEQPDRRVILYDTGDFIDDYAVDAFLRNDLSALFFLELGAAGIATVRLLPVRIDDMQVNVARGEDRAWFVRRLRELCEEMNTEVSEAADSPYLTVGPAPHRLPADGSG